MCWTMSQNTDKHIDIGMRRENPTVDSGNRFSSLASKEIDSLDNGGHNTQVFGEGEDSDWTQVNKSQKRARISTGGKSSHTVDCNFSQLSIDDKLSTIMAEMQINKDTINVIENKLDHCLSLQNKVDLSWSMGLIHMTIASHSWNTNR